MRRAQLRMCRNKAKAMKKNAQSARILLKRQQHSNRRSGARRTSGSRSSGVCISSKVHARSERKQIRDRRTISNTKNRLRAWSHTVFLLAARMRYWLCFYWFYRKLWMWFSFAIATMCVLSRCRFTHAEMYACVSWVSVCTRVYRAHKMGPTKTTGSPYNKLDKHD